MEISRRAYNEREHYDAQNAYRRAERKISETPDYDGSPEGNVLGYSDGSRNERGTSHVSRQAVGEELRHDAGGSLSSVDRDGGRDNIKEQFSLREPVEQVRDLVAVHGLTEQNLRGALVLGGLPVTE